MQTWIFPLLIVVLAVPLFLSARKQKRAAAKQQDLQKSIGPGDRVMTTSGLYGTVASTTDDTIDIEIAPGVVTTWLRAAVREKVNPGPSDVAVDSPEEPDEGAYASSDTSEDEPEYVDAESSSNGEPASTSYELAPPLEKTKRSS